MQTILLQLEFPYLREVNAVENKLEIYGYPSIKQLYDFKQQTNHITDLINREIGNFIFDFYSKLDSKLYVRESFLSSHINLLPKKYEYSKDFNIRDVVGESVGKFGKIIMTGDVVYQIRIQIKLT